MFNPTRDQARRFFIEAWDKSTRGQPLVGLEQTAADIVALHPEYHDLLARGEAALAREWAPEEGRINPFLHLSLHLAIEEQLSIDQPPGIRVAFAALVRARGERHAALHQALECLGETLWRAERDRSSPDGEAYIECLRRRA